MRRMAFRAPLNISVLSDIQGSLMQDLQLHFSPYLQMLASNGPCDPTRCPSAAKEKALFLVGVIMQHLLICVQRVGTRVIT